MYIWLREPDPTEVYGAQRPMDRQYAGKLGGVMVYDDLRKKVTWLPRRIGSAPASRPGIELAR